MSRNALMGVAGTRSTRPDDGRAKEDTTMAMTNEMIIMDHAQQLAEEGKIAYTGNTVTLETVDGEGIVFKETE